MGRLGALLLMFLASQNLCDLCTAIAQIVRRLRGFLRRWLRQTVPQVSNLLYRMASSLPTLRTFGRAETFGRPAGWKSAIQQVGNLRFSGCGFASLCSLW